MRPPAKIARPEGLLRAGPPRRCEPRPMPHIALRPAPNAVDGSHHRHRDVPKCGIFENR